ncbi:CopD family protein [Yokenella regensburgei]|uniref:CopD family protein n=1 Tax=Yokenella regensburgei TaxID=158877 RepID=UPI003F179350
MNFHPWLNAVHIIAAIIWLGGMLVMAVVVGWSGYQIRQQGAVPASLLEFVRTWSRKITSPAMILLWVVGIAMIVLHGRMPHLWLVLKIVIIIGLSGIHGVLTGTLRRLAAGSATRVPGIVFQATPIILVAVALVILLAVFRPF